MPTLSIRQLEGSRRVLELSGLAGPLAGVSWGVRQRGESRRFPGSRQASAHLLGPEETATELEFRWRSRDLGGLAAVDGDLGPLVDADDLVAIVSEMVRESSLVLVSWRGREKPGWLRELDPEEGRLGEWTATLTVEWLAPGAFEAVPEIRTPDAQSLVQRILDGWIDTLGAVRKPITLARSALAPVEAGVNKVNSAIRRSASVINEAREGVSDARAIAGGVAGALSEIADGAQAIREALGGSIGGLVGNDDPEAQVRGAYFRARIYAGASGARRRASLERRDFAILEDPDVIGVHVATEGEDLRKVALRYYGQARVWFDLAQYNKLGQTRLYGGQRVLLPQLGARV